MSKFVRANATVDYPLYTVDYDPEDDTRIIVGGGGGANRSGVPNKIVRLPYGEAARAIGRSFISEAPVCRALFEHLLTCACAPQQSVLETTKPDDLRVVGELDLTREEDNVASLAFAGRKGKTINIFAGINSSPEEIDKGKNEHLRSIAIKAEGKTTSLKEEARHPLFVNATGDVYQRLLRISGSLGAAGSGFGKDPQIALFDVAGSKGGKLARRGTIELPKEAQDLDLVQLADGSHLLTYCYQHELYLVKIGKGQEDPQLIYSISADEPNRPSFRFVRFVGPEFILAAANMPGRSGVAIHGFRLAKAGQEKARLAVSAKIPRKINATALAVANLTPPRLSPKGGVEALGDTQFVIAIAGNESSISLFSLTHVESPAINLLTKLHPLSTLMAVHGADNITGLAFSRFSAPAKKAGSGETQYLKLVSISLQKMIALHSIPLKQFVNPAAQNKNAPVRYVTKLEASAPRTARTAISLFGFVVLIMALAGQAIVEYFGQGYPILNPQRFFTGIGKPVHTPIVAPPVVHQHGAPVVAEVDTASFPGGNLLARIVEGELPTETLVLYADTPAPATGEEGATPATDIKLEVHDEEVHGPGKAWDELPEAQQNAWKDRLHDAGAWTQQMGESIFKGILFGEIGGAIGHAVAG
ncbi:hypothetical protein PWT90_06334 [Aphanocladium album]|nr:hypothetical protein PWT90_06334 [Aphanocladium album]